MGSILSLIVMSSLVTIGSITFLAIIDIAGRKWLEDKHDED